MVQQAASRPDHLGQDVWKMRHDEMDVHMSYIREASFAGSNCLGCYADKMSEEVMPEVDQVGMLLVADLLLGVKPYNEI